MTLDDAHATALLQAVRKPLLTLHKAILDHERASYQREFGPTTAAGFLQVLITGAGFRWLAPMSTLIANVDEALDAKDAGPADRIAAAETVRALFDGRAPAAFLERYQPLLHGSPDILHLHGQVAAVLRGGS